MNPETNSEVNPAERFNGSHLTDEQFTELLLGAIPPAVAAHLDACPPCADEAARVSSAIGSFEQQSRLWAERRAATSPAPSVDLPSRLAWLRLPATPAAWSAACAGLVLVVGLAIGIGSALHHPAATVAEAPVAPSAQPSATQPAAVQPVLAAEAAGVHVVTGQAHPAHVTRAALKADNELLSAIDGELSASVTSTSGAYGLSASSPRVPGRAAKGISN